MAIFICKHAGDSHGGYHLLQPFECIRQSVNSVLKLIPWRRQKHISMAALLP